MAREGENPGSAWSGQHLHFIVTTSASGVPNAASPDRDPAPIILAELAGAAGEGGEEFDPMPTLTEIFHTPITKAPDGSDITLAQFMSNQGFTLAAPLLHPLVKNPDGSPARVRAGDFLRSEPAEHANTRAEVARLTTMVAALGAAVESISSGAVSSEQIAQIADAAGAAARESAEAAVAIAHAAEMEQLAAIKQLAIAERDSRIEALEAELEKLTGAQ
jgi:hypothetical protein